MIGRPQHALDAVGRQQFFRLDQRRQPGRVRRVEEAVGNPEHEGDHRQLPDLDGAGQRQHRRRAVADAADQLDHQQDDTAAGSRSATTPPISTDSTMPRLAPSATKERSVGRAAEFDHLPDRGDQPDSDAEQRAHQAPRSAAGTGRCRTARSARGSRDAVAGRLMTLSLPSLIGSNGPRIADLRRPRPI